MKKLSLKYTVLINSGPNAGQRAFTALEFCRALLKKQQLIQQLFFYSDGVYLGARLHHVSEDETDILALWQQFIIENDIPAKLCVTAALKRGIFDDVYAAHYQHEFITCANGFKLVGLSELYESMLVSERFISF